jgi:hypothetical protein
MTLGGPGIVLPDSIKAERRGDHVLLVNQMIVKEIARFREILERQRGKAAAALEQSVHGIIHKLSWGMHGDGAAVSPSIPCRRTSGDALLTKV